MKNMGYVLLNIATLSGLSPNEDITSLVGCDHEDTMISCVNAFEYDIGEVNTRIATIVVKNTDFMTL